MSAASYGLQSAVDTDKRTGYINHELCNHMPVCLQIIYDLTSSSTKLLFDRNWHPNQHIVRTPKMHVFQHLRRHCRPPECTHTPHKVKDIVGNYSNQRYRKSEFYGTPFNSSNRRVDCFSFIAKGWPFRVTR